jgi:hypothetical protein
MNYEGAYGHLKIDPVIFYVERLQFLPNMFDVALRATNKTTNSLSTFSCYFTLICVSITVISESADITNPPC